MALSKPLSNESAGSGVAWFVWAEDWPIQAVRSWGDHLQLGCRELQKGAQRLHVKEPLLELSDDLIDFSLSVGRCIASPLCDLAAYATCATGNAERRDLLMGLSRESSSPLCDLSSGCSSISSSRKVDWLGKDGTVLSLLIAGLLVPSPSGVLVLASIGPTFSLKAACAFAGTSMLWKCWLVHTRSEEGTKEQSRQRKDLAVAVTGICGIVNLSLAFGGLPALFKLGCISLNLSHYVAHQDIFVHYLADIVLNPLLILNMVHNPQVKQTAAPNSVGTLAFVMPSMAASTIGACCMVGTSLAISPCLIYSFFGANVCCVIFQNWDLQALFSRNARAKKICDAYLFSQMLYTVPTVLAVALPCQSLVAVLPLVDLFGKMGVLQLTMNDDRPTTLNDS